MLLIGFSLAVRQLCMMTVVIVMVPTITRVLIHEIMNATTPITSISRKMVIVHSSLLLYIGNDGQPIPAENRQSLFVPFFTTKRSGSGIGLSLSRRMMTQQGGMLELAEKPLPDCHVTFILTIAVP